MTVLPSPIRHRENAALLHGRRSLIVTNDVQERLEPGLDPGVGGVRVDLEDQVGLGAHLGRDLGVGKGVHGAAEIADADQEQVGMFFGQGHGVQDLVGEVPGKGPLFDRRQAISGDGRHAHAREFPADRLGRLGCVGVVAAAGKQDRWFSFRQRTLEGLLSQLLHGPFSLHLGALCRFPGLPDPFASDPELARNHLLQLRTAFVATGEIQDRGKKADVGECRSQEKGTGLGDRAKVGITARAGLGHARHMGQEDQIHALLGKVQDRSVRGLRGKAEAGIGLQLAAGIQAGQDHIHSQACEEGRVERVERVR